MSIWTYETVTVKGDAEDHNVQKPPTSVVVGVQDSSFNLDLEDDEKKQGIIQQGVHQSPTNYYDAFSPSAFNRQDSFFQGQAKINSVVDDDDDGCYEQAEDTRCRKIQAFDGTGWRYTSYGGDGPHMFDDDSL